MTDSILPAHVYYIECDAVAQSIAERAYELALENHDREEIDVEILKGIISDEGIDHEEIDGHEYCIYYKYHSRILQISEHYEGYIDECGIDSAIEILSKGGTAKSTRRVSLLGFL